MKGTKQKKIRSRKLNEQHNRIQPWLLMMCPICKQKKQILRIYLSFWKHETKTFHQFLAQKY